MSAHLTLTNAYLCVDCETVGGHSKICAACAGSALLSLAAILNREAKVSLPDSLVAAINALDTRPAGRRRR